MDNNIHLVLFYYIFSLILLSFIQQNRIIEWTVVLSKYRSTDIIHRLPHFAEMNYNQYDYDDIKYPIPFNILFHNLSLHYVNNHPSFLPDGVYTGDINEYSNNSSSDIIIISACSQNHLNILINSMLSCIIQYPNSSVVIVNIGISEKGYSKLAFLYESIIQYHKKAGLQIPLYYREYNFDIFPEWMSINNSNWGGYSWKPIIIYDVLMQWKATTLWTDAANYYRDSLKQAFNYTKIEGYYMPCDVKGSKLRNWFFGLSRQFLIENRLSRIVDIDHNEVGGAAFMLFNYRVPNVMKNLITPWIQCSYTRKCIIPNGARQQRNTVAEQGIMAMLVISENSLYSNQRKYDIHPDYWLDRKNEQFQEKVWNMSITHIFNHSISFERFYNRNRCFRITRYDDDC